MTRWLKKGNLTPRGIIANEIGHLPILEAFKMSNWEIWIVREDSGRQDSAHVFDIDLGQYLGSEPTGRAARSGREYDAGPWLDDILGTFMESATATPNANRRIEATLHEGRKLYRADVEVTNHGPISLFLPNTKAAKAWIEDNVSDDASWHGNSLAVEHRYVDDLWAGMEAGGLEVAAPARGGY